ncbi:serine/threonine protein kinase [Kribbella pittospori]|uniref:non-specific serine/threonine protein kinase n=2 Tax=Kribbella pittospori TaxID=722689 RepID=A0A4R0KHB5_9ACTN|nr:serine/threonine protein kinase [Kribbella pittospori]
MGEVYRATDEVLRRPVAVKLMLPIPQTLAAAARFLREARATARIRDPHVVAAYDFGKHGEGYFLAMELMTGRTVGDELRRHGPLSPERARCIVRQAAAGLAAAHRHGIVHRDIKPGNLLLGDDGTVKVADFGIVRFAEDTTTTLTSTGQIVGTSHYLSPERAVGKPAEGASDVYALGCVLYQLVTGHPPFLADDPASIMFQHVQREPIPPSELRAELAGEFEALLLWMLAKDPVRRPTAAQVADGVPPPVSVDTTEIAVVSPRGRRRPVLAGVAAALALSVSATLGIILETRGVEVPVTNDLTPGRGAANPPAVTQTTVTVKPTPSRPQTSAPTANRPHTPSASKSHRRTGKSSELAPPAKDKPAKTKPGKPKKPEH